MTRLSTILLWRCLSLILMGQLTRPLYEREQLDDQRAKMLAEIQREINGLRGPEGTR